MLNKFNNIKNTNFMDIKTIKRKNDFYEEDSIDSKKYNDENISISKNFNREKKFKKIIILKILKILLIILLMMK